VYENKMEIFSKDITHSAEQLSQCKTLLDQYPMRKEMILQALKLAKIDVQSFNAVAARGGTFGKGVQGGAYLVDATLLEACRHPMTNHPSNLAALIAHDIAAECHVNAYIYDAVCVNETKLIASFTGLKGMKRKANSHVLNTRAVCRKVANEVGKSYEQINFIAAHLGGGISINIHEQGRIIDVISDDEGPMSPERSGGLNALKLVDLCYSGKYTQEQMKKMLKGNGGLISHLGTNSAIEVEDRIRQGDSYAKEVFEAMAYQIAKGIGALATTVSGKIDYVIITGGIAHSNMLTELIKKRVEFIAPVKILAGSMEMEALADGISDVLTGKIQAKRFTGNEGEK